MRSPCWAVCEKSKALLFGDVTDCERCETEDMRVRVKVEVSQRWSCMTASSCDHDIAYISSLQHLADRGLPEPTGSGPEVATSTRLVLLSETFWL